MTLKYVLSRGPYPPMLGTQKAARLKCSAVVGHDLRLGSDGKAVTCKNLSFENYWLIGVAGCHNHINSVFPTSEIMTGVSNVNNLRKWYKWFK